MMNRVRDTLRSLGFLGLVAIALGQAGCDDASANVTAESAPRPVKTYLVTAGDAVWSRTFSGTVEADDSVRLAFLVPGRLAEFAVVEGQELKKGDLIGRLDARDFQHQVDAAKAQTDAAQSRLARLHKAREKNAVSEIEVIEQEAAYRSALARLNIARKALDDTTLTAPYDGVVAETVVDQFQDLDAGQPCVLFQATDLVDLKIAIPEQDLVHASQTQPGRFSARFRSLPDREFDLQFKEIATQADATTQTYELGLTMESPRDVFILPGMTAEITWERALDTNADRSTSIEIPVSSTFALPNGDVQVWVVDSDSMVVARRRVQLGALAGNGMITVVDGLEPGDMIAAAAVHHLRDGITVRSLNTTVVSKATN